MTSHLRFSTRLFLLAALLVVVGLTTCSPAKQGGGTPSDQTTVIHPPAKQPSRTAGR